MNGRTANPKLFALIEPRGLQVADLACACSVSRQALCLYSAGRKALPRVEAKLARFLKLSVPVLRMKLGQKKRS